MMCIRIGSWRQFAKALGLDYLIRDMSENDQYNDIHEKINKCIVEKRETAVDSDPDWCYWRSKLIQIGEEDLVDDIEDKFPHLVKDDPIDKSNTVHKAVFDFGIIAHNATKKKLFEKWPINLKHQIEICVGAGDVYKVKEIQDMTTIQDDYFKKYKLLQNIKVYDFSNVGKIQECKILQTMYTWLQNNNDSGFCVKGYDAKQHAQRFCQDYFTESPYKDSYILLYSNIHNVILYVDTDPTDIKESMKNNNLNINNIRSSNQCLDGNPYIYIPVTLCEPEQIEVLKTNVCTSCFDLGLIVSSDQFKDIDVFKKWWDTISTEVEVIINELKTPTDISTDFLKSIIGYMAFASLDLPNSISFTETPIPIAPYHLPNFTSSPEKEIQEVKKMIMFTPEQQSIIYSKKKRKIIKGSFGSGKTIVAQQLIKYVTSSINNLDFVYYIIHDNISAYIQEMKKLIKTLNNNNVIACKIFDLVGHNESLSSILMHLLKIHEGNAVHVFIEEFNGEVLDEDELARIKFLLKKRIYVNSHIVLVCQSMEIYQIQNKEQTYYNRYQFEKLSEQANFEIFNLSYLMRSSQHINKLVDVAIPILDKAVMRSVVPKFEKQLSSKSNTFQPASNIVDDLNIEPLYHYSLTKKTCKAQQNCSQESSEYAHKVFAKEESLDNKLIANNYKLPTELTQPSRRYQPMQSSSSDNLANYNTNTCSEQLSGNIDDTAKLLKHLTLNANQYKAKVKLENRYKFVGERETAHMVKGKKPILYYPFNQERHTFIASVPGSIKRIFKREGNIHTQRIFCLSKVLTQIEKSGKGKDKQIIICMNDESKTILQDSLEVNGTKWTGDPKLFATKEFRVLLTDYTSLRGCEFMNVILIIPIDERHLKHNVIDCLNRCIMYLSIIVLNLGIPDETLVKILGEWKCNNLVEIVNENYLKNVTQEEIKAFNDNNEHLFVKDRHKQLVHLDDSVILRKLYNKTEFGTNKEDEGSVENPESEATSKYIWNVCKIASTGTDVLSIFDALKQNYLNINSFYWFDDYNVSGSLLHYAVYKDDFNVAKFVIEMGVNINIPDGEGASPLHYAAEYNRTDILQLLLQEEKIDVNIKDNYGNTPLLLAIMLDHYQIVELLLQDDKIDVYIDVDLGVTALHYASGFNNINIVKLIIQNGKIDVNATDIIGITPLHWAARINKVPVVELLLQEENIDINLPSYDARTPLHSAANANNIDTVKLLLQNDKIVVNTVDDKGETPIHSAVLKNHFGVVELLLQQDNSCINIADNDGWVPLHRAAFNNNINIAKLLLLKDNIDISVTNKDGETPLDIATREKNNQIMKILTTF